MISIKAASKLLTVSAAALTIATGCATAKKGEMAEAAAEPMAPAAAPAAAEAMASDRYTVVQGDCLWCISGMTEIYNDPFYWPILFSRNRDQIRDADLIYPGQVLTVARQFNPREVANAIRHAKTRGPWTLGVTEAVDTAFLAENVVSNETESGSKEYAAVDQQ